MKTTLQNIAILFLAAIAFASCTPNNEEVEMAPVSLGHITPENGRAFSGNDTLHPVTFRWTPLVPKPREAVTYRLRVWQLMQGQNGTQAMRDNQPKITKDVVNLTEVSVMGVYTGPCKPPYLCDFIWSVQAILPNGTVSGQVVGTSNPTVFNF